MDPNQELVALGATNLVVGLFQGFPISSSSSRTPVAEAAGARSQMTGVVGALGVTALLLLAPQLLERLPYSALAAVVIASVMGLIEWRDLQRIRRMQAWEFWLSIGCAAGVLLLGAIQGIALAIVVSVVEFLWDGWRPHAAVLGKVPGVDGWHDVRRHPEARTRFARAQVAELAALQRRLLTALAPRLQPGGVLVYSVCSYLPEEGEGVIADFLRAHPEFERLPPDRRQGAFAEPGLIDADGALRTLPHRQDADGFFAVRLRRTR